MQNLRSSMPRALDPFIADAFESREAHITVSYCVIGWCPSQALTFLDNHGTRFTQASEKGQRRDMPCMVTTVIGVGPAQQFETKVDPFLSKACLKLLSWGRLNGDSRNSDVCVNILDRICQISESCSRMILQFESKFEVVSVSDCPNELLCILPGPIGVRLVQCFVPNSARPYGVTVALAAARDADRNTNGDDSHNSRTGVRRTERTARECTYTDFLKCQPLNFKGTE
ncbi:hypothetical protein Tco_1156478 [Tanacetum coccineum]